MKYRLSQRIVWGLATLILCTGCVSEGSFNAEKLLWRADYQWKKNFKEVPAGKEEKISEAQRDELIYAYKEITLRYPYWLQTYQAHFKLAKLYLLKGDQQRALKEYDTLCKNFALQPEICAKALKSMAEIYEIQGNWPEAEILYKKIMDEYLNSSIGLLVPLYLAQQYQNQGLTDQAQATFVQALGFYKKIIAEKETALGTLGSIDFAVICILNTKTPQDAIEFLNTLKSNYPNSLIEVRVLWNLARIYQINLNDQIKAKAFYQEIVDKYPQINLAEKAQEQIKDL
ncbi:MAG: tetratricopeptide repeat protein [Candidatus Omnitrophota bacterium]